MGVRKWATQLISAAAAFCFLVLAASSPALAGGFVTVDEAQWNKTAVRKVLHTFAYGGFATDRQIAKWARMDPRRAIRQMLTFKAVNGRLSEAQDITAEQAGSLEELQDHLSADDAGNPVCPGRRDQYSMTRERTSDGEYVLYSTGLQNTWVTAANLRGVNPFRQKVGFWLVNYHTAVNLHDIEAPLIRELYDSLLDALAEGSPFNEVLALGASSAAVAREYGHQNNRFFNNFDGAGNNIGVFRGNDDFAREFHQLFFRINGDIEDPDYHEDTTIEHTAWVLTGMQLDKEPLAYGTTLDSQWWVAPIDFLVDHVDGTGRSIPNVTRHYDGDLEILHETIFGATAEDKLYDLSEVAIHHPESLRNLPVAIINFFADDNLNNRKIKLIRAAWRKVVGSNNDLLKFLRTYATSKTFHRRNTYKFRTAFDRNMALYNLNTVDNEEVYGNSYTPRSTMQLQGADVFKPAHDVFGGQTSINAANNANLFKDAYNSTVDAPNRLARISDICRDESGNELSTWEKDWARIIPAGKTKGYQVKKVGQWLWERFAGDGKRNYKLLERAYVAGFLATGRDLGYIVDPDNPDVVFSTQDLKSEPLASGLKTLEGSLMDLDSDDPALRSQANRRVGLAVSFISMTPFTFAMEGR